MFDLLILLGLFGFGGSDFFATTFYYLLFL